MYPSLVKIINKKIGNPLNYDKNITKIIISYCYINPILKKNKASTGRIGPTGSKNCCNMCKLYRYILHKFFKTSNGMFSYC